MGAPHKDSDKSEVKAGAAYVVAPRRTVNVNGKPFGPGQTVNPPAGDVAHLLELGFIVDFKDGSDEPVQGVSVGGLQIRGGKRPGASIA